MKIAALMLVSINVFAYIPDKEKNLNNENTIIEQAIELDQSLNLSNKTFDVVSLSQNELDINNINSTSDKAIQSVSINGNLVEVTTVLPYKLLSNGELLNSFDYIPLQTKGSYPSTITLVDVTVTVTSHYAKYYSLDTGLFYRHAGVEAY